MSRHLRKLRVVAKGPTIVDDTTETLVCRVGDLVGRWADLPRQCLGPKPLVLLSLSLDATKLVRTIY